MSTAARLEAIHEILDDISGLVGAPALVEDASHVVIAYSQHDDPGDAVRASTILGKRALPAVTAWLAQLGIARAPGPVHVPSNPALGMQARVCFPLRGHGQLLGYLWFIDQDKDMSAFDVQRAALSARALASLLQPRRVVGENVPPSVMGEVLSGRHPDSLVLQRLADRRLETGGRYRVLAVRATGERPSAPEVRRLLRTLSQQLEPGAPLSSVVDDVGRLLYVEHDGGPDAAAAARLALRRDEDTAVVVGVGDPVCGLDGLPSADATALDASACAATWPQLGPVVDWPGAGLYRLVPLSATTDSPVADVVATLREVLGRPEQEHLLETVETYLDLAGHAQEAAAALTLHRATLYQRLQRFVEVTGLDVKDGPVRSLVHLALKAARFEQARERTAPQRSLPAVPRA